jgi:hypothetical protein
MIQIEPTAQTIPTRILCVGVGRIRVGRSKKDAAEDLYMLDAGGVMEIRLWSSELATPLC